MLVAAAVWLGAWQYDAWSTRRADEARDVTRQEPVPLDSAIGPDDAFPGDRVGAPVIVAGTWVPSGTLYVSGREHEGRDGLLGGDAAGHGRAGIGGAGDRAGLDAVAVRRTSGPDGHRRVRGLAAAARGYRRGRPRPG